MRNYGSNASKAAMNRLYVVETAVSCTGAKADHRLPLPAGQIELLARAVAAACGVRIGGGTEKMPGHEQWVAAVADDLQASGGRSLVLAGDGQPPEVHLLAPGASTTAWQLRQNRVLHRALGNRGGRISDRRRCADLAEAMDRGDVEMLVILGGNPVYMRRPISR